MLCLKIGILVQVRGDNMKMRIDDRIEEEYETKIEGKFKIKIGDKTVAKGKNKWTRYFPSSLVEFILTHLGEGDGLYSAYLDRYARGLSYGYTARAGNDITTPSSPNMSDLVSKIDIAPDSQNRVSFKEPDYSEYKSRHKFMWNPGTIPAQIIGELGVYLYLTDDSWESPAENPNFGTAGSNWAIPISGASVRLGARISSADGDFDPIDYTSEEALILEWYVTIKF